MIERYFMKSGLSVNYKCESILFTVLSFKKQLLYEA